MPRSEKLMSVSRREFEESWRAFDSSSPPSAAAPARIAIAGGQVVIRYEPRPPVRLGGLLELPRAVVKFEFEGVEPDAVSALLERFDRAFQRGGG